MLSFFLLCWILLITTITVLVISATLLILSLFKIKTSLTNTILRSFCKIALLFHKIEVIGENNILKDKAMIIFANHQSNFDILLVNAILNIPFSWFAKESLFKIPIFGFVLRGLGHISVSRGNSISTFGSILKSIRKLKEGISVFIFPEGTWNNNPNKLLPFKKGIYNLAKESHVPLLPITIIGSNEINPPDTYKVNLGKLKLVIHSPIYSEKYLKMERKDFLLEMRAILEIN